ncbi:MAG: molybdenum cofactor guanylyltransferase [Eubacteriales bacterium]|nr:molybdenum cofactor guanylyltransferase [Eubacteriales bacterium]
MRKVSMVILAGGASSRMGREKADLLLDGKTFLETQIAKGRRLGIADILVSGYRGETCSARVVMDRIPKKGPLGGMEACFREAREEWCLVLGVDVPLVPEEELERLIACALESGERAVILEHGGKEEPLIGVYKRELAEEMVREIMEGKGSVFGFLRRIGYGRYRSGGREEWFWNVNEPGSYERVKGMGK